MDTETSSREGHVKVVCVLGSARENANSTGLALRFCDRAMEKGADVATFALNDLTYKGCQGCNSCKTTHDHCVVDDDLTQVLEAVRESDVIVAASPIYFGALNGQLKSFIDRTYSFLTPDFFTSSTPSRLAPGKKLLFVITQAAEDESAFSDVFPRYRDFFKSYGFADIRVVRGCGLGAPGQGVSREELASLIDAVAEDLLQ